MQPLHPAIARTPRGPCRQGPSPRDEPDRSSKSIHVERRNNETSLAGDNHLSQRRNVEGNDRGPHRGGLGCHDPEGLEPGRHRHHGCLCQETEASGALDAPDESHPIADPERIRLALQGLAVGPVSGNNQIRADVVRDA